MDSEQQPNHFKYFVHIAIGCRAEEAKPKATIDFIFDKMRKKYRQYIEAKAEFSKKKSTET